MPPPDWLSWEFWIANRDNIAPLATFFVQLATLVVAAIVAVAALAQARTARRRHEEQTTADRERRITESFAKAVEQPWPPRSDHPVVQRLQEPRIRPETDVQAILTVLGRRDQRARKQDEAEERRLDLVWTDLRGADLREAHLEGASLSKANLQDAFLFGARLEDASLWEAVGLTRDQLNLALGNAKTIVAEELRPAHWPPAAEGGGE